MVDFIKAKFQYLATFERFGWMSYLTTQHPIHENLFRVLFSNATLENAGEEEEDLCHIVAINLCNGQAYLAHPEGCDHNFRYAR